MKRLYRTTNDLKLGGVMGGLGEYLQVDANALRLAAVALGFLTGIFPFVLTYLVAWVILPEKAVALGKLPLSEAESHSV